ncbi:MAG: 4'-phosphopantetheinyl transferase superfamily protein [Ignavibacteriaceae bacterium]|nr:4'-phosphopantetheinyl transferase superfamily protein [Ignavibacteriaceae bacterium]
MRKRIYYLREEPIELPEDEVHIWNFDLNKHLNQIDEFVDILSSEELIRASKFHFDRDKNWFIISRGLLRVFVNFYSAIPAAEIKFITNSFGKPSLSIADKSTRLHFNLSHSKNFMSIGFTNDNHIGIDVELMKPLKDHVEIAKRFFSASEVEQLFSFPADKILDGFYSCWTAKEAVIKLSGEGLSFPLKEFDVELKALNPGESCIYKVNLKKRSADLLIEVCRLNEMLYSACAIDNVNSAFIHCYFDENDLLSSSLI